MPSLNVGILNPVGAVQNIRVRTKQIIHHAVVRHDAALELYDILLYDLLHSEYIMQVECNLFINL